MRGREKYQGKRYRDIERKRARARMGMEMGVGVGIGMCCTLVVGTRKLQTGEGSGEAKETQRRVTGREVPTQRAREGENEDPSRNVH